MDEIPRHACHQHFDAIWFALSKQQSKMLTEEILPGLEVGTQD